MEVESGLDVLTGPFNHHRQRTRLESVAPDRPSLHIGPGLRILVLHVVLILAPAGRDPREAFVSGGMEVRGGDITTRDG